MKTKMKIIEKIKTLILTFVWSSLIRNLKFRKVHEERSRKYGIQLWLGSHFIDCFYLELPDKAKRIFTEEQKEKRRICSKKHYAENKERLRSLARDRYKPTTKRKDEADLFESVFGNEIDLGNISKEEKI